MSLLAQKIKERLDEKLSSLQSFRLLPDVAVRMLQELFGIEMTCYFNAIEGNSLNLKETFLFPLAVVLKNDRKRYYRTLAMADRGEHEPFVGFIVQAVERSLNIYLKTLTPAGMKNEKGRFLSSVQSSRDTIPKFQVPGTP